MIKNGNTALAKQIYDILLASQKVTIFAHENKDNDAYGSSLGLCYFLRSLGVDARIDDITSIVSCSVTPFIDYDLPTPDDAFMKSSTGVLLDVGNSNIVSHCNFNCCQKLVRIDHHIYAEKFAEHEWVDHNYSSTCEMIGWLILTFNSTKMTKQIAEALYVGILTDTGRFMFNTTQASTFELIGEFYKFDFEKNKLQDKLFLHTWDCVLNDRNLSNEVKVTTDGIAYIVLTENVKNKYCVCDDEGKIFIMNDIKDFKVWFSVYYRARGNCYKISIRSRQYPVREIACKYNGGGHLLASGFTIQSLNQIDDIINDIRLLIKKTENI